MRRQQGFTLVEVLVAAFVAALVFGFLVSWMAQNLRAVGNARAVAHALLLGEQRARDYDLELRQSGLVEPGVEHGEFPDPDGAFGWEVSVEPWHLPLPADYKGETSPSPLFEPSAREREQGDPPLHLVTVRVFKLDAPDTDLITPFEFFGVVPGESPQTAGGAVGQGNADDAIYDTNHNGKLDPDELRARDRARQQMGTGEGRGSNSGSRPPRSRQTRDQR